jgi:biopolymer transport protein ExbD
MSRVYPRGRAAIEANLTPMIDMTFLLIVFFVLVSRISEVENVRLELPRPFEPATVPLPDEQRVVLNVIPDGSGGAESYRVGVAQFPPTAEGQRALEAHLAALLRATPDLQVNLRADRATAYAAVAPALEAVAAAARGLGGDRAARVNLVVIREDPRRGATP